MVGYDVVEDEFRSKIFGHKVYEYICKECGEVVDSNGNFNKTPNENYCSNCGNEL